MHKTWIEEFKLQRVVKAASRGHAKSTWHSLVYPLWCLLFKKKKFIVLISDTSEQAEGFLGTIIEELETNDKIIRDFGKIAGYIPPTMEEKKKWTAKEIITTTDVKVIAKGWNARIRGIRYKSQRPDLVILDDVENDENVRSEDQRAKVKNTFFKSILNLGDRTTQIIVIGTILHFDSLLMHLIDFPPPNWSTRLYKAYKDDGTPLWPEEWSAERLEEKREEIGSIAFEQEFMNNPLDPSQQILKPSAWWEGDMDYPQWDFYGYVDLAISEKETADYTALVTIARHKQTGEIRVIDPVRIRGDITTQLNLVFKQHAKFRYTKLGIESVAYQKAFAQVLRIESQRRGIYIPAIEIEVDKDKVRRAQEVSVHVENGTVKFNRNYTEFNNEIIQFPKASHDDFVDSFCSALKLAIFSGTGTIISGGNTLAK